MSPDAAFVEHLLELLEPVGGVTAKRMFGGYGIFQEGTMFGLVAEGTLYLKTDAKNRREFEDRGLPPFQFEGKNGRNITMTYHQCPDEALDSPLTMTPWARSAWEAGLRSRKPARKKTST